MEGGDEAAADEADAQHWKFRELLHIRDLLQWRTCRVAFQTDGGALRCRPGIGGQQCLRVGMLRPAQQICGRPDLDDFAEAHHRDPVADLGRDIEVVGDEQHRQPQPRLQCLEQREHLRLDRDVERRHRLVGHQHVGVERQRARNADPLPLPAGEFMRKASRALGSRPTSASSSSARANACAGVTPCAIGPSAMIRPTRRRGLSEAKGPGTPSGYACGRPAAGAASFA